MGTLDGTDEAVGGGRNRSKEVSILFTLRT
jgi:hypothetical protein